MKMLFRLGLVGICLAGALTATAQQATIFPFLRTNLSARQAALGGATSAMTGDAATVLLNPAAIATVDSTRISATFLKNVLDINSGVAILVTQVEGLGTVAATAVYSSSGSFTRATEQGTRTGTFSAGDVAFGISLAREIDTLISYGATLKFISSNLDDMASTAIALDAGIHFRFPASRTNLALSVLQLGTQLSTYDGSRDRLPVDVRIGINHRLRGLPLLVNASLNHLADDVPSIGDRLLNFSIGGELYLGKALNLRIGYDNTTRNLSDVNVASQLTGLSGGVGLLLGSTTVDYGLSTFGSAVLLHRLSVGIGL